MPNILTLTAEAPDALLNAGAYGAGAVIRVQTGATETGAFADVSGTGSTPTIALVAATRSYTGYDPNGIVSSWYRTRFENGAASRVSDWSAAFQVGDETAGLLCSLYDVQQELGGTQSANDNELILEKIAQVSRAIERYTGRWFTPRPLSGTTTYRFHTSYGRTLHVPKGIRSITSLAVSSIDQADTGGTYTTATVGDYFIDPPTSSRETGEPGLYIRFKRTSGLVFYDSTFGAEVIGAFGWASVPADIQAVATGASARRFVSKGGGGVSVAIGPNGTEVLLPDLSGSQRAVLDMYRELVVA